MEKTFVAVIFSKFTDNESCLLLGMQNFDLDLALLKKKSCKRSQFFFDRPSKMQLFHFSFLNIYGFLVSFAENLMKKLYYVYYYVFKTFYDVYQKFI